MAQTEYRRLTGTKAQHGLVASGRSSLWLGEDHLLRIDSSGYTETYRRFYLRDIQAVVIRKTIGMQIWLLVFGGLALLMMMLALDASDPVWMGICWGAVGLLVVFATINLLLGPVCRFHIRTAVQMETISSITRMRKARRILEQLRPLLAIAQGEISREEVLTRYRPAAATGSAESPAGEVATAFPLASDIPNPTATETGPETGPNSTTSAG